MRVNSDPNADTGSGGYSVHPKNTTLKTPQDKANEKAQTSKFSELEDNVLDVAGSLPGKVAGVASLLLHSSDAY
jgi:hypothetical protein